MKKIMSIAIIAFLFVSLLSACASNQGETSTSTVVTTETTIESTVQTTATDDKEKIDNDIQKSEGEMETQTVIGTVISVDMAADSINTGRISLLDTEKNYEIIFNFSEETIFNIKLEDIVKDTELSIKHNGAMTKSMPPQAFAMEVSAK